MACPCHGMSWLRTVQIRQVRFMTQRQRPTNKCFTPYDTYVFKRCQQKSEKLRASIQHIDRVCSYCLRSHIIALNNPNALPLGRYSITKNQGLHKESHGKTTEPFTQNGRQRGASMVPMPGQHPL